MYKNLSDIEVNMKKKIVSLLLAAAVSASALSLVACGDDKNDEDGVLKSDKVASAAEWESAFDFSVVSNATLSCVESGTYYGEEWSGVMKLDGEKLESTETEDGREEIEYYMYKADELTTFWDDEQVGTMYHYTYDKTAKKWTYFKYGTDRSSSSKFRHFIQDINEDFTPFYISEKFDDFTYDEKNYEYVATWDSFDDYTTENNVVIKIKIKNGKLAEGSIDYYEIHEDDTYGRKEGTVHCEFKVYDIGKTEVDLPDAEEETDEDN